VPNAPTFSTTQSSTSINVSSWYSWDQYSNNYTVHNESAGRGGIATYTVALKNSDGTTKVTKSFDAKDNASYTFNNLTANTNYKVKVTATDVAGNANSLEKSTPTAPDKPKNLVFSSTEYTRTTLSWDVSAGATEYNVYSHKDGMDLKINSSPIITNSYTINDLEPNSTYTFNVIAISNAGQSDNSDNATVTTLQLPPIEGPSVICSGINSYSINNLLSGYSVSWSCSANLDCTYSSGSSANFNVIGDDGQAKIQATLSCANCKDIVITKEIWVGNPSFMLDGDTEIGIREPGVASVLYDEFQGITNVNWTRGGAIASVTGGAVVAKFRAGSRAGYGEVYATATNGCGSKENRLIVHVKESWYAVYPNPTRDILNIKIDNDKISKRNQAKEIEVRLYDRSMSLKKYKKLKSTMITLNVSDLKSDMYILQLKIGDEIYGEKIIVSNN